MTHPLIDINKPIRLTDFGKKEIDNNINLSDVQIDSYPITINRRCFTMTGKFNERDALPSIENYEPIKEEPVIDTRFKVEAESETKVKFDIRAVMPQPDHGEVYKFDAIENKWKNLIPGTFKPTEIELSQVERMAWEVWTSPEGSSFDIAFRTAQKFMDEVKKRREREC